MIRQFELVERVKAYDPLADEDAINRAYVFATKYHGSQKRASGDPYFSHPVEVAGILTDLKLDHTAIITALLHDTVEDTEATLEDIERLFGKKIARLVDGVTKLTRLELQSEQSKHAENFRKLLLAMSDDIRVLMVKLADRLHNMRTIHFIKKEEKRQRIARETMEIYAPLSERIGMQHFKDELEDLSFAQLHPEARESILTRLDYLKESDDDNLADRIISKLREDCAGHDIEAEVSGRLKAPYSIFRKMQTKDVTFEQLSDIMAFRIITDDLKSCYQALGMIHSEYPVVPGRFKDYISTPKPNGYQSIHTAVIGPQNHKIEMQIRTREMHEVNEYGVAAHWAYKQGDHQPAGKLYRWLQQLIDILEHTHNPEEFLEHTKMEMFQDQVFCFTPKGELISLPHGATPIDFAYAVHTEVGNRCVGAKVNGRMVQFRTPLNNGDQVQILTSKNQTPSPDWEKLAVSGKAKACIRRFIRLQEREQYLRLGQQMLEKVFRQENESLTEKALEGVLGVFHAETTKDLTVLIGQGHLTARDVLHAVYPEVRERHSRPKPESARQKAKKATDRAMPIKGLIPGMAVHYAKCCHPLPGDRIVGIVTTGKGVTIHTIDCDTLSSFQETPERWIDVSWDDDEVDRPFQTGRLKLIVANEPGTFGDLFTVIGRNSGNVSNMKIVHRTLDFFEMLVDVEVQDVRHLANIQAALRAMSVITSVERARN
ncbi:RelA/SpoT family protein [Kiloniella sp. b19]|uniref:RelA/SpoT family protein n=1 Tax=Kiloniella sp. GXU_MW_B19 TaxID=3141326 RepID=UPI0031D53CC5